MRNNEANVAQGGTSIFTIVQAALIIMKIANLIKWPWWKVFLPVYIWIGLIVLLIFIVLLASK